MKYNNVDDSFNDNECEKIKEETKRERMRYRAATLEKIVDGVKNIVKLGIYAGVGCGIIYLGAITLPECSKVFNKDEITSCVKKKQFDEASRLLEKYGKEKRLYEDDMSSLKIYIEKEKKDYEVSERKKGFMDEFNESIEDYDLSDANSVLIEARNSGLFSREEIKEMEDRTGSFTEERLYEKMTKSNYKDLSGISQDYLKLYPNGAHKKEAIENLLTSRFSLLFDDIGERASFDSIYSQLTDLNADLEKYTSLGISLSKNVPLKELTGNLAKYLEDVEEKYGDDDLDVGLRVRVNLGAKYSLKRDNDTFLAERDKNFPSGSVGIIINYPSANSYLVKFSGITMPRWTKEWEPENDFWRDGKKNVAEYCGKELTNLPLNPIEKQRFTSEISRLEANFAKYTISYK